MPIINLREFLGKVDGFADTVVPETLSLIHRKIALQALTGVVNRTPVDTGRARGNWQTTVGSPVSGEVETTDKNGGETISGGLGALTTLPPFSAVWITNNLPYIEALENGHSDQAPGGMLALTVNDISQQFSGVA